MSKEIATAVLTILDRYAHDNGKTILTEDGKAAENLAGAIHAFVLDLFRKDTQRSLIAERYRQYPESYSAPLCIELTEMMVQNSTLTIKLQGLVARYETAVSVPPVSTKATVTGSGTIVQGDANTVIGAGATYIEKQTAIHLPQNEAASEGVWEHAEMKQLRKQVAEYFNLNDLQNLCWDLGIPYEELGGDKLSAKVRGLLGICWRNGRIADLLAYCRKERPHVEWPPLSE